MYHCPGCGGQMVFDIASARLKCRNCDRSESVQDMDSTDAAHAENGIQGYSYTCPNCGGSLFSVDTTAATFCSFCGSSVMLEQRIAEQVKPERIIPFAITKEECVEKFREYVRKGSFVNRKLLSDAAADAFRGIYIPYRNYQMLMTGELTAEVSETHGNTEYIYEVSKKIDVADDWVLRDLSQTLPDDQSARINEFDRKDSCEFLPGYLAGFYADVPDVDPAVYHSEVRTETADRAVAAWKKDQKGSVRNVQKLREHAFTCTRITGEESVLVPVWFMCVRNGDRVCYAIVNGATGRVSSDLPVDRKRVSFTALAAALLIFLLLYFGLRLTLKPQMTVSLAAVMLAAICGIVRDQNRKLHNRDTERERLWSASEEARLGELKETVAKKKYENASLTAGSIVFFLAFGFCLVAGTSLGNRLTNFFSSFGTANKGIMLLINTTASVMTGFFAFYKNPGNKAAGILAFALTVIAVSLAALNPPEDLIWWGMSFLMLLSGLWCEAEMIRVYNIGCTRCLPVFDNHQGGEDRA